jgi:hypothetical protein
MDAQPYAMIKYTVDGKVVMEAVSITESSQGVIKHNKSD